MIDIYKFMLILVVYTAILLLVIFYVYPYLNKLLKRGIYIRIGGEEKKEENKTVEKVEKQEKLPSILGKPKFVLSQPLPNAATNLETGNRVEKEPTFVPETKNQEDENVNCETGEGIEVPEEGENVSNVDLNREEEAEDLGIGNMPDEDASGITFNELGTTAKAIKNPNSISQSEEDVAGRVLSENKYTQLVISIQESRNEYAKRITELIDRYDEKLAEEQNRQSKVSCKKQKIYDSDEFKNFSVENIS
ncbi:MAG: hypothetical protein LBH58_03810 [Tannerellaceae bacterium]|jgi:hypothetical protein|nr:hypothetical protein [Tannerellaceae bacterium]